MSELLGRLIRYLRCLLHLPQGAHTAPDEPPASAWWRHNRCLCLVLLFASTLDLGLGLFVVPLLLLSPREPALWQAAALLLSLGALGLKLLTQAHALVLLYDHPAPVNLPERWRRPARLWAAVFFALCAVLLAELLALALFAAAFLGLLVLGLFFVLVTVGIFLPALVDMLGVLQGPFDTFFDVQEAAVRALGPPELVLGLLALLLVLPPLPLALLARRRIAA